MNNQNEDSRAGLSGSIGSVVKGSESNDMHANYENINCEDFNTAF